MIKKKIIFALIILAVAGVVFLILNGSYPIAWANGKLISAQSFDDDFTTAIFYYQTAMKTYNQAGAASIGTPAVKQEIKRAVLDKEVEDILISDELLKYLTQDQINQMVNNKIEEILKGQDITQQVRTLYNLSMNEFRNKILEPQARLEILQARMDLENVNFDNWIKGAKQQTKVIILLPGFSWANGGVMIK